jgi:hypothetical protein
MLGNLLFLSLTGVLMGGLTVFVGLPLPWEPIAWVLCFCGWVVFALRTEIPRPFVTIVAAGPLCGTLAAATQVSFFDVYQAHNPWYAEELGGGLTADLVMSFFLQGTIVGGVFGAIFGTIALAIHTKLGRR